ncbi:MAG: hypothetical protein AB7Y46_13395 [Armatimonadota bacterium]
MDLVLGGVGKYHAAFWVGLAIVLWVWRRFRSGRALPVAVRWALAAPVVLACVVALVTFDYVDSDEQEHLHASYLVSLGQRPFIDFFEHHNPTLYYLLAPLIALLPRSAAVLDASAAIAGVLALMGVLGTALLARRLWGPGLGLWAGAIFLTHGPWLELHVLRPDVFATVLALAAVWVLAARRDLPFMAASGGLLAAALCFVPKQWLLGLLAPAVLLPGQWRSGAAWRQVGLWLLGLGAGIVAYLAWLHGAGLLDAWRFWVIEHNARVLVEGRKTLLVSLPAITAVLALGGYLLLRRGGHLREDRLARTAVAAVVLALLGAVIRVAPYGWDMQLPVMLGAVLAAEPARLAFDYLHRRSVLLTAALAALLLGRFVLPVAFGLYHGRYSASRAEMTILLAVAGDEGVVCRAGHHPVLATDATDLWHWWQWERWMSQPAVRERLSGIGPAIRRARPPIIYDREPGRERLLPALRHAGLVEAQEAERLGEFLAAHYTLRGLRTHEGVLAWFWIRNDRMDDIPRAP